MTGYAVTAQFYDALAGDAHAAIDARIADALAGLDTSAGPVIDIGAGTGLTTRVIAAALSDAEIFAIEPDPSMRSALMTRIWSDTDLRRRVSILPTRIADAPLPAIIAGAVLSASLVHFTPDERAALWVRLAGRLAPAGRIIVEVQCPEPAGMPETRMGGSRIGRVDYEGWASAEPLSDDRLRWRMTYRAAIDGVELSRQTTTFECATVSADRIISEGRAAGLTGYSVDDLAVLSRDSDQP